MILVLTHSADFFNVDIFFDYLTSKSIPYFRLNTDELNQNQQIAVRADGTFTLKDSHNHLFESHAITGVWHRKTWKVAVPDELDPDYAQLFFNEYRYLRNNLYQSLAHLPWINPLENEYFVERNKLYQLRIAREAGLNVPETIFTNSGDEIRNFLNSKNISRAVAKLHGPNGQSMSGAALMETILIESSDEQNFEGFEYCPMIIQPYIEKEFELRLAYVDGKCFSGKINNRENTDWRTMQTGNWERYEVPCEISEKIKLMMNKFGLITGAIDIIKGTDGNYWFLEVNPQGEWGMLQKELNFPIAEAIADSLIKRIKK